MNSNNYPLVVIIIIVMNVKLLLLFSAQIIVIIRLIIIHCCDSGWRRMVMLFISGRVWDDIRQSFDLQRPGSGQNGWKLLVGDAHLSVVHESQ